MAVELHQIRNGANPWVSPVSIVLARTAPSYLPSTRSMLRRMAAHFSGHRVGPDQFPWWTLTYGQVAELRAELASTLAPKSAANYMGCLRSVLRECKRLGLLEPTDFERIMDQPPIRGHALPAGRHVSPEELEVIFQHLATLSEPIGVRDRTAFALLVGTGVRRAEACALAMASYQHHEERILVHGKGGKQRVVYLPEWVTVEIEAWLQHRGFDPGALLCAMDRHGHMFRDRHLSPFSLWERFRDHVHAACAEVDPSRVEVDTTRLGHVTPHDLRRTYIGNLLEAGIDIGLVAKAAGHSSPSTTLTYDRRPACAQRKVASVIPSPLATPRGH